MLVKCIKVFMQPGCSLVINGVKKNSESGPVGEGNYFKNLGHGKGLFSQSAELLLLVEVGEKVFPIPIDKQFRKKFQKPGTAYAQLNKERMKKIDVMMPKEIDVEETGNSRYPYQVKDSEIDDWYERVKAVSFKK